MCDVTPAEEWRPVVGYEGRYEVSNTGLVRSLLGRAPRILRPGLDSRGDGYQIVALHRNHRQTTCKVHVLVARAFIGERPNGHEIRHLDGRSQHNCSANIAYGTHSQNEQDKLRHGTDHWTRVTHCKYGHEFTPENTYTPVGTHRRFCRRCARIRWRRWKDRRADNL